MLPGVGAFPQRHAGDPRAGARRAARASACDAGVPVIGLCLGMQLLFESSTELGGARGPGAARGRGERARGAGPQGAADRLEPGLLEAALAARTGPAGPVRLLPRALLRGASGAARGRARHSRLRRGVRDAPSSGHRCTACSSTRRSRGRTGWRCSATSCAAACPCPHDLPARGRHSRRSGRSGFSRATSIARRCMPTTPSRRRGRSSTPGRASCTWWTSTARARASRSTCTTWSESRTSST